MNKLIIFILLTTIFVCASTNVDDPNGKGGITYCDDAFIPENHRKVFWIGEKISIPLQFDCCHETSEYFTCMDENSYTFEYESGNDPINFSFKKKEFLTKEEKELYYSENGIGNASDHWRNKQSTWNEFVGTAMQSGVYRGTITIRPIKERSYYYKDYTWSGYYSPTLVYGTNAYGEQKLNFSFEVKPLNFSNGLATMPNSKATIVSRDAAASYSAQMEIYSYLKNNTDATQILDNPFMDYYMTIPTEHGLGVFSIWKLPENSCIQVFECENGNYVFRQKYNGIRSLNPGENLGEFQLALYDAQRDHTDLNIFDWMKEKNTDENLNEDFSYLYPAENKDHSAARNEHYNYKMASFEGKGNLLYGSTPEWFNSSCRVIQPVDRNINPNAKIQYRNTSAQNLNFCNDVIIPSPKITIEFDSDKDVIYEGEDYFSMPTVKSTEGEISSLKIIEQEDYDWLETGSPADYWKNNYGNNVAGVGEFTKKFYVRSINGAVREKNNIPPGSYTYTIQAKDNKGNVATVKRTIEIIDGKKHPAANSNGLAVLVGDETWFKKYQLDIATGVENYANEGFHELKKGYHYDYYGQLQGSVSNQTSKFYEWYSNPGFTQILDDCGGGRYRIRYEFTENSRWYLYFNQSYFDIKTGIVNNSESELIKTNDYSMQPFVNKGLYGRKYNPNVPLYDEKGNLLWGTPPEWKNNCREIGVIKDFSHDNTGSSDVILPSEKKLTVQFYDAARTMKEQGQFNFKISNVGSDDVAINGYEMRFYYGGDPSIDASNIAIYPNDLVNSTYSTEKCAENLYVLKIKIGEGAVAKAGKSFPEYEGQNIGLQLQMKNTWSDIGKKNMHSWTNDSKLTNNPKMSLFDAFGRKVYGEKDLCNPNSNTTSEEYKYNNLTIQFQDSENEKETRQGNFKFQINNSGSEDYSIGNYEMRFYFRNKKEVNFDASEIRFFNGYIANAQITKEWCGDGNYFLKIKLGSDAVIKANSHFPENGPINVITRRILKENVEKVDGDLNPSNEDLFSSFNKENLDSWRNFIEMKDNGRMGLFDGNGIWIWGHPGYKCENPITITSRQKPDESRFLVEETERLFPYTTHDDKGDEVKVENGINEVSLRIKNVSDLDEEGPIVVDYYITHPDGQVPLLCYGVGCFGSQSSDAIVLSTANKIIKLTNDISVLRLSIGNKHVYRFILESGLKKKNSKTIDFSLRDECVDCIEEDFNALGIKVDLSEVACSSLKEIGQEIQHECEVSKYFIWNLSDDWSAEHGVTDEYKKTEHVVIYSKDKVVLYGEGDSEIPKFKQCSENCAIPIPGINVQDLYPNRTDAIAYSGGQLLQNGDFEESSLVGWNLEHGEASSIRGNTVQGSRFLRLNGRISQTLPNTALSLLLDSGAVLTFWHRSDECSSVSSNSKLWLTMPSSTFGYGSPISESRVFDCSSDWKKESVSLDKERFMTSIGRVNDDFTIKFSSTVNVYFDDITLVPGKKEQPSTYAVRFTTTQHEELETRAYDNDRDSVIVTNSERDAMGRSRYKYLPYKMKCFDAENCNADPITLKNTGTANAFYDGRPGYADAQGFPYSETLWKPDPAATKDVIGAPGKAYSIGEKHVVRAYSSGVNLRGIDPLDFSALGSAVKAVRNHRVYDELDNFHAAIDSDPTHIWELNLDQNDNAAFIIKDGEGHIIISGAMKKTSSTEDGEVAYELVSYSVNELDARGNVIKAHPPMSCGYTNAPANCVNPSMYEYDSQSRVIRSWEPDLEGNSKDKEHHGMGSTITYYDMAGRVRATQTQNQINNKTASVVIYDDLDRVIATGEWKHGNDESSLNKLRDDLLSDETLDENKNRFPTKDKLTSGTVTRTYYDKEPSATEVAGLGVELHPDGVKLNYTRGRVAAIISDVGFDDVGNVIHVSTANSYDKYGRVVASYTYDPTLPADLRMMAVETEYDLGGKVLASTKYPYGLTTSGRMRGITESYTYDRLGRVSDIYTKNGNGSQAILAHYEYYPTGSVKNIIMGNALKLSYTYHISGAVKTATVKSIDGKELYSETLHYEDSDKPQYNGNISRMVHQMAHGNDQYGQSRDVLYLYDELNRLTSVDDSKQDVFDEMFEYDAQGRITAQHRAQLKNGKYEVEKSGGEYFYESEKNRLKSVADNMGGISASNRKMSNPDNFIYDSEGNLTDDKSKGLKISYDWRGMPIEFLQESQPTGSSGNSLFRLTMAYDGSGRRISKTRWVMKSGAQDWEKELVTHYTGIGTEIRESFTGANAETKVVVNMPNGLGRYGIEDAVQSAEANASQKFEWYLKNHLGSTMLVYGTVASTNPSEADVGEKIAAYDYRSFGEMVELTPPATGKITENFTGKEHDDEISLDYFGARYLDPMLGMWISVDPARQFVSPYLYAGNGVNPIGGLDPSGMYFMDKDGNITTGKFVIPELQNDEPIPPEVFDELQAAIFMFEVSPGILEACMSMAKYTYDNDVETAFGFNSQGQRDFIYGIKGQVTPNGNINPEDSYIHFHNWRGTLTKDEDGNDITGLSPADIRWAEQYNPIMGVELQYGNVYYYSKSNAMRLNAPENGYKIMHLPTWDHDLRNKAPNITPRADVRK